VKNSYKVSAAEKASKPKKKAVKKASKPKKAPAAKVCGCGCCCCNRKTM